ncbi:hypothetical protein FOCC_FOCC013962 [Frankliniella occidentalis]|nr:hypothetical protein FOCC_FOCC013962 [Frankliniella occidentalis]
MRLSNVTPGKSRPGTKVKKRVDIYGEWVYSDMRKLIHQMYRKNKVVTAHRVVDEMQKRSDHFPPLGYRTVCRALNDMGFRFMKRHRNSILLERDDLVIWRQNYLRSIKKYRSDKYDIIYLDESYVNQRHTTTCTWYDTGIKSGRDAFLNGLTTGPKTKTGKGGRFVLLHAGGAKGFVPGAKLVFKAKKSKKIEGGTHHDEMCSDVFHPWFEDLLLGLENPTVIVMDNASYHSKVKDPVPGRYSKKSVLLEWLWGHDVNPNPNLTNAALYQLILEKNPESQKQYIVDEMASAAGHKVLRLPSYHCELNPIEHVWGDIKQYIGLNNTQEYKMEEMRLLIDEAFELITDDRWKRHVDNIIKVEDKMMEIDHITDMWTEGQVRFGPSVEPMVIPLGAESSDEEEVKSAGEMGVGKGRVY